MIKDRVLELKPFNAYPKNIIKDLNLLRVDKYNSRFQIIGSSSYRGSLYPSDFDCFEVITKNDRDDLITFFKKNIQRVVRLISEKEYKYIMEVKLGLDDRYDINIGSCHNNVFNMNIDLPQLINGMYHNNLFSDEEITKFNDIFNTYPLTQLEYEKIKKMIRQHYIVRWTSQEIMRGYKFLPMREDPYTIEEAIQFKSSINIEILSINNGKVTDESNFFYLMYHDKYGNKRILNFKQDVINDFESFFTEQLKQSLEQLAYSKLDYNPLKALKRMFSLCRLTKNTELLKRILPIINSPSAGMYQLKSEIATIIKVLGLKDIPVKIIKNQIQQIKYKLSNVLLFSIDDLKKINQIIDELDKTSFNPVLTIEILEYIKSKLSSYVNDNVTIMMKEAGLLPLIPELLPQHRVY
jgi:hypothetical protein